MSKTNVIKLIGKAFELEILWLLDQFSRGGVSSGLWSSPWVIATLCWLTLEWVGLQRWAIYNNQLRTEVRWEVMFTGETRAGQHWSSYLFFRGGYGKLLFYCLLLWQQPFIRCQRWRLCREGSECVVALDIDKPSLMEGVPVCHRAGRCVECRSENLNLQCHFFSWFGFVLWNNLGVRGEPFVGKGRKRLNVICGNVICLC